MRIWCGVVVILCWVCAVHAQQLAFPTAEGFGRFASGGRGGGVYKVTTLASSGPGSLRACLEDANSLGARTCIFDVAGIIDFGNVQIQIVNDDLTIAGQTAPGEGVIIKGLWFWIASQDVIVRHTRFRVGSEYPGTNAQGISINVVNPNPTPRRIIIDHCSISWAKDDSMTATFAEEITFQWNLIAEGLQGGGQAAKGGLIHTDLNTPLSAGISYHHNMIANNISRLPDIPGGPIQFVNNVLYNGDFTTLLAQRAPLILNMRKNYYRRGPSATGMPLWNAVRSFHPCWDDWPSPCSSPNWSIANHDNSSVYLEDNFHNTLRPNNTFPEDSLLTVVNGVGPFAYAGSAHSMPTLPSETTELQAAIDVRNLVGATVPLRDAVDERILICFDTETCEANLSSETQVGGYPVIPFVQRPAGYDTDGDGMPDTWETTYGLNPNDPSDGPQLHANGYSNLENFLNQTAGDIVPGLDEANTVLNNGTFSNTDLR